MFTEYGVFEIEEGEVNDFILKYYVCCAPIASPKTTESDPNAAGSWIGTTGTKNQSDESAASTKNYRLATEIERRTTNFLRLALLGDDIHHRIGDLRGHVAK